jgi:hypothetical protein
MSKKEILIKEIGRAPEAMLDEVLDFLHFLQLKVKNGGMETATGSESSLKKDWMKPEEDEAWKHL